MCWKIEFPKVGSQKLETHKVEFLTVRVKFRVIIDVTYWAILSKSTF